MAAEERSIKFLLKDEFLHQFGLLHSSRSTQPHEVPDSPAKALDAPVSTDEPVPKELTTEASLVKCSIPTDIAGPSCKLALTPVIEEEEDLQQTGKTTDEGVEVKSPVEHSGDDTFEGLSDFIVTSQELFKDDLSAAKIVSPVVEATSALQQTPPAQESTLAVKSFTTLQLRSSS